MPFAQLPATSAGSTLTASLTTDASPSCQRLNTEPTPSENLELAFQSSALSLSADHNYRCAVTQQQASTGHDGLEKEAGKGGNTLSGEGDEARKPGWDFRGQD